MLRSSGTRVALGITVLALASRRSALEAVSRLLARLGAERDLVQVARRADALLPQAPPSGPDASIVTSHDGTPTG